jgi:hypothetical protein
MGLCEMSRSRREIFATMTIFCKFLKIFSHGDKIWFTVKATHPFNESNLYYLCTQRPATMYHNMLSFKIIIRCNMRQSCSFLWVILGLLLNIYIEKYFINLFVNFVPFLLPSVMYEIL